MYSILFVVSFILGYLYVNNKYSKYLKNYEMDYLFISLIFSILFFSRLGEIFFYNFNYYKYNVIEAVFPIKFIYLYNNKYIIKYIGYKGLSSHGGLIGILIGIYFTNLFFIRKNVLVLYDIISLPIVLGCSLIRIGNYFNNEIIGIKVNKQYFINRLLKYFGFLVNYDRYPVQLYESILYIVTYFFLLYLVKKKYTPIYPGHLFLLSLFILLFIRFFIEFIKEPQENEFIKYSILNTGQILTLFYIVLFFIFYLFKKYK